MQQKAMKYKGCYDNIYAHVHRRSIFKLTSKFCHIKMVWWKPVTFVGEKEANSSTGMEALY